MACDLMPLTLLGERLLLSLKSLTRETHISLSSLCDTDNNPPRGLLAGGLPHMVELSHRWVGLDAYLKPAKWESVALSGPVIHAASIPHGNEEYWLFCSRDRGASPPLLWTPSYFGPGCG